MVTQGVVCIPVKLVQTLFTNKSIPEQATRLVGPNLEQVLSWAIPRPRVQIVPQEALDPVRQVTWGEEVVGVVVNSKLGTYLQDLTSDKLQRNKRQFNKRTIRVFAGNTDLHSSITFN